MPHPAWKCNECNYYDIPTETCRVGPPSAHGRRDDSEFGGWPSVRPDDWCGVWAPISGPQVATKITLQPSTTSQPNV